MYIYVSHFYWKFDFLIFNIVKLITLAYVTCPELFGSIIGGVVGGLIVIVLAVVAIVCILRKYPNVLKSE